MTFSVFRAGLTVSALVLGGGSLVASPDHAKYWCKVENNSGRDYTLTINDTAKSVGSLWIRKAGDKGNGQGPMTKGATYHLAPGQYEFYFDTTLKTLGIHFLLQESRLGAGKQFPIQFHVTNLENPTKGFELQVGGKPMRNCNVVIDPTGFRNLSGGVLITITDPTKLRDRTDTDDSD